jgi:regulator of Ty1 transposition protein 103
MPEAAQTAYRSSTPEIQNKIRRVVEVWKSRNVFEAPIIEAIETRLNEIDKAKGSSGKKTLMGNSLFHSGSAMPKELETLGPLQTAATKAALDVRPALDAAEREYSRLNDPEVTQPSLPVHAARLSSLIKSLAAAESSVSASIKARQSLIADLERILQTNKGALAKDEEAVAETASRKTATEAKKREVEDAIMRGLTSADNSPGTPEAKAGTGGGNANRKRSSSFIDERPEVEELTPEPDDGPPFVASNPGEGYSVLDEAPPAQPQPSNPAVAAALSGFGDTGSTSRVRVASGGSLNGSSTKRRKLSHEEDQGVPDLGSMGMDNLGQEEDARGGGDILVDLDAEVSELLRQEGGGTV